MESNVNFAILAIISVSAVTSLVQATDKPIRVTTILHAPYVSQKAKSSEPPKNEDFEGYIPDLLNIFADRYGIKYQLKIVRDGKYGVKAPDGTWSGMVGEIVNGEADLAAAPLTMSSERSEVVDFTEEFMKFDKAIVMKKPVTEAGATSTPSPLSDIKSVKELDTLGDRITYGVITDGTTAEYFRLSTDNIYRRMWEKMNAGQWNVRNTEDGIKRVREGLNGLPYAFIIEETMAEYAVSRKPCDLFSVRGQLETRSYALATRKNSPLKAKLDAALKELTASGDLDKLRRQWWADKSECSRAGPVAALNGLLLLLLLPVAGLSVLFWSA